MKPGQEGDDQKPESERQATSSEGNLRGGLSEALASLYRAVTAIGLTIVPRIEGELVKDQRGGGAVLNGGRRADPSTRVNHGTLVE